MTEAINTGAGRVTNTQRAAKTVSTAAINKLQEESQIWILRFIESIEKDPQFKILNNLLSKDDAEFARIQKLNYLEEQLCSRLKSPKNASKIFLKSALGTRCDKFTMLSSIKESLTDSMELEDERISNLKNILVTVIEDALKLTKEERPVLIKATTSSFTNFKRAVKSDLFTKYAKVAGAKDPVELKEDVVKYLRDFMKNLVIKHGDKESRIINECRSGLREKLASRSAKTPAERFLSLILNIKHVDPEYGIRDVESIIAYLYTHNYYTDADIERACNIIAYKLLNMQQIEDVNLYESHLQEQKQPVSQKPGRARGKKRKTRAARAPVADKKMPLKTADKAGTKEKFENGGRKSYRPEGERGPKTRWLREFFKLPKW